MSDSGSESSRGAASARPPRREPVNLTSGMAERLARGTGLSIGIIDRGFSNRGERLLATPGNKKGGPSPEPPLVK